MSQRCYEGMVTRQEISIVQIVRHRNGISGAPFHVVTFDYYYHDLVGTERLVGIVFEEPQHIAIFSLGKLAKGDIAFGSNSWRGDRFEWSLRDAIKEEERTVE